MSEQITEAGIAYSIPSVQELINVLMNSNIFYNVETNYNNEIDYIECISPSYDIVLGENNYYVLKLLHASDEEDIEQLYSIDELNKIINSEKYLSKYKSKFFINSWYNGVDSPYIYWNW